MEKTLNISHVMLEFDKELFSLYLADLNEFISRSCKGLEKIQEMDQLVHDPTEDLVSYLKLYILMYADDTVL